MTTELDTLRASDLATLADVDAGRAAVLAYLGRLRSDASRRSTAARLRLAAAVVTGGDADPLRVPWHELTPAGFSTLAAMLADDNARGEAGPYSARSINATLAAVRGVLRECWRSGLMSRDELARVVDGVKAEQGSSMPAGRSLAAGELDALYRAIEADPNTTRAARDAAMLALLYGAGLRAAEAAAVAWSDVDLADHVLTVRRGKGRKSRRVGLAAGAGDALAEWRRVLAVDVDDAGPILRAVNKGGRFPTSGRWSTRAIGRACDRLAKAAMVAPFTPHDMRRSYAGDMLDTGADLVHVQGQLGHASPTTTAGYDRRPDRARFDAARRVRLPYRRPAA